MWGEILKRDLLGEVRQEDRFHTKEEVREYIKSEIQKQGENVIIRDLDVSLVEDLSELFEGYEDYYDIKYLDLSGWKTSNVKDMSYMFRGYHHLEYINLSGWDTSNVKNMDEMFCEIDNSVSLTILGDLIFK